MEEYVLDTFEYLLRTRFELTFGHVFRAGVLNPQEHDGQERGVYLAHEAMLYTRLDSFLKDLDLQLPQWCIGGGVIRNIVFDNLSGTKGTLHRDVDVAFFCRKDLTRQRDKEYESRLKDQMATVPWEVTNQAGVHLWFHKKYGYSVPPLKSIEDAIATWPETCSAVGIAKNAGKYKVYAPCGLNDLFNMVVRRNPRRVDIKTYRKRIEDKQFSRKWPSVKII